MPGFLQIRKRPFKFLSRNKMISQCDAHRDISIANIRLNPVGDNQVKFPAIGEGQQVIDGLMGDQVSEEIGQISGCHNGRHTARNKIVCEPAAFQFRWLQRMHGRQRVKQELSPDHAGHFQG